MLDGTWSEHSTLPYTFPTQFIMVLVLQTSRCPALTIIHSWTTTRRTHATPATRFQFTHTPHTADCCAATDFNWRRAAESLRNKRALISVLLLRLRRAFCRGKETNLDHYGGQFHIHVVPFQFDDTIPSGPVLGLPALLIPHHLSPVSTVHHSQLVPAGRGQHFATHLPATLTTCPPAPPPTPTPTHTPTMLPCAQFGFYTFITYSCHSIRCLSVLCLSSLSQQISLTWTSYPRERTL